MTNPTGIGSPATKRLFTVKETAAYLGVSPNTVYHWVCKREIPFVKLKGRAVRFDRIILDQWIDAQEIPSGKEAERNGILQAKQYMVDQIHP